MHPPLFTFEQRLSDWPDCFLELTCPRYRRKVLRPVALIRGHHGDATFRALIPRLCCETCRVSAKPIYLCASHVRTFGYGGTPGWSVELVPPDPASRPGPG